MKKSLLLMLFMPTLWAQNLVGNGSFDQGVSQWDDSFVTVDWIADDGDAANGSLEIRDNFNNGGSATTAHAPVEIISGQPYTMKASTKVMPNTEAQGSLIIINWLDENQMNVGFSDYVYSDTNVSNGTWHKIEGTFTPPEGMKYARIYLGVIGSSSGSSDYAVARWDDIRFSRATVSGFEIVQGHSGSWYDAAQSGHGINIEILGGQQVLVFWYVFDLQGNSQWIYGLGSHDGSKIVIQASMASGAMFPPAFDPNDVNIQAWGEFEIHFIGCSAGVFKWTPNADSSYQAGSMNITRLTQLAGLSCQE